MLKLQKGTAACYSFISKHTYQMHQSEDHCLFSDSSILLLNKVLLFTPQVGMNQKERAKRESLRTRREERDCRRLKVTEVYTRDIRSLIKTGRPWIESGMHFQQILEAVNQLWVWNHTQVWVWNHTQLWVWNHTKLWVWNHTQVWVWNHTKLCKGADAGHTCVLSLNLSAHNC